MGIGSSSRPHNDHQSPDEVRKQKYLVSQFSDIDIIDDPDITMLEWLSPDNTLGKQIIADFGSLDNFRDQVDWKLQQKGSGKRKKKDFFFWLGFTKPG